MPIIDDARQVLERYWGYPGFRPMQEPIIESVLSGRDTLGLLPTGGGKSITFQVPAMLLPGLTLVVTPLISLMKDQVDNLLERGIRAYALHSGLSRSETNLVYDRCRLGKARLLYVSPERLQTEGFTEHLRHWDVSLIVVDEAHCISQWGYDFRPSYLKIRTLRRLFPDVNVLALPASATPEVAADIAAQLEFRQGWGRFARSFDRENLSYVVRHDDFKDRTLLRILRATQGCSIVYTRSRRRTREIAEMLGREGISASFYHAGLDPEDKTERQNAWKDDQVRVMVATNAFGMGIDKSDVRLVVHYDLPSSLEEYYQEAGRAGRDGKPSFAAVIVARTDKAVLSRRLSDSFPPKEFILKVYELAGNFLDVAVGDGYNQIYEFDFDLFCQRFSLPPTTTYSALKILTRAGYIEYVDEVQTRSRAMITARKSEFYSLQLDDVTDRVFSALQRTYTGLFADYVHIDERKIARVAEVPFDAVYPAFLALSRMKVLSYVPGKSTPFVVFTTSREEPRYVKLSREAYEDRRERMARRIKAVTRLAFDDTTCRSRQILEYFGETDATDCGRCDVCRSVGFKPIDAAGERSLESRILQIAGRPEGATPDEVAALVPAVRRSEALQTARRLVDEERISFAAGRFRCAEK